MSARQKLNGAVLSGAFMMGALAWVVTGSGGLALTVATLVFITSLGNGAYRPDPPPSRPHRRCRR